MASRRLRRWGLWGPFLVLALLAAGWSGLWYAAQSRGIEAVDRVLAREAAAGRDWRCPGRATGGFPFRFELVCDKPSFAGATAHGRIEAAVQRLDVIWQIWDPAKIVAIVQGPLAGRNLDTGEALTGEWTSARASFENFWTAEPRLSAVARALEARAGGMVLASADQAEAHVRRSPRHAADDGAFDVLALLQGAAVPEVDAALGNTTPSRIELQATVSRAETLLRGSLADRLERWRTAGGAVEVALLSLDKGNQRLAGKGSLSLDALKRPQGSIEGSAAGLDEALLDGIVRRAGGEPALAGLIAGGIDFLARRQQKRAAEKGPRVLPLPPVRLADGRVFLGPVRLPVRVPPLY